MHFSSASRPEWLLVTCNKCPCLDCFRHGSRRLAVVIKTASRNYSEFEIASQGSEGKFEQDQVRSLSQPKNLLNASARTVGIGGRELCPQSDEFRVLPRSGLPFNANGDHAPRAFGA